MLRLVLLLEKVQVMLMLIRMLVLGALMLLLALVLGLGVQMLMLVLGVVLGVARDPLHRRHLRLAVRSTDDAARLAVPIAIVNRRVAAPSAAAPSRGVVRCAGVVHCVVRVHGWQRRDVEMARWGPGCGKRCQPERAKE